MKKIMLMVFSLFLVSGCSEKIQQQRDEYHRKVRARQTNAVEHIHRFRSYHVDVPKHKPNEE